MRKTSASIVAGFAVGAMASGSALAADATFENHLTSPTMVSPAQLYQIQEMRTDFALGYDSTDASAKADTSGAEKTEASQTQTDLFAAGIYNVKSIGLRAGLGVKYGTYTGEQKQGDTKGEWDGTEMVVTPQVAMPVGPVVIGAAVDAYQQTEKMEDAKERKASFTTFRPGVLFANDNLEAGIAYASPSQGTPAIDEEDKLAFENPATTTLHGRYAVTRDMAFGGVVEQVNWQGVDKDMYKATTNIMATSEFRTGAVKMEGNIGMNGAYNKEKETLTAKTMGTYELGAAADYTVNTTTTVGGGLGYEFGSATGAETDEDTGTSTDVKYDVAELSLLVRGDMKF